MKHKRNLTKLGFLISLCLALLLVLPGMSVKAEDVERYSTRVSYTNPLYAEDISDDRLRTKAPVYYSTGEIEYQETMQAAAAVVRDRLEERAETFTVGVKYDEWSDGAAYEIFFEALEHTGEPTEGDYIKFTYGDWTADQNGYTDETGCYITITYTVWYYTTAEQEAEMDIAVEALLTELDLDEADDYTKVRGIYDYLCANITYDYDNLNDTSYWLKYTAYAALINKTAVCQGYANLFYRLALELGVDARIIPGYAGEAHAWNIVKIGDVYYNLDATWDAGKSSYDYFLQNQKGFDDHIRHELYDDEVFHAAYPMSEFDYGSDTAEEYVVAVYQGEEIIGKCESISEAFALVTDENGEYRFEITGPLEKDYYIPAGEWPKAKLLEFWHSTNELGAFHFKLAYLVLEGDVYLNSDVKFSYISLNCTEEDYFANNKPTLYARNYTMYFEGCNEFGNNEKQVSASETYNLGICIDGPEATLVSDENGHFKMFDLDITIGTAYMDYKLINQGGSFICDTLVLTEEANGPSLALYSNKEMVFDIDRIVWCGDWTFNLHINWPIDSTKCRIGSVQTSDGQLTKLYLNVFTGTGMMLPKAISVEECSELEYVIHYYDTSDYTVEELEALMQEADQEGDSQKRGYYKAMEMHMRTANLFPAEQPDDLMSYKGTLINIGNLSLDDVTIRYHILNEYDNPYDDEFYLDALLEVDSQGNVFRAKDEILVVEDGVLVSAKSVFTDLVIPEKVVEIPSNIFTGSRYHSITFGPGVESVGREILRYVSKIEEIYLLNPDVRLEADTFAYMEADNVTIHGYTGSTAEAYVKIYGEEYGLIFSALPLNDNEDTDQRPAPPKLIALPLAWDTTSAIIEIVEGINEKGEQFMRYEYADGTEETHTMIWSDMQQEYIICYIAFYPDGHDQGGDYRIKNMPTETPKVGDVPYPAEPTPEPSPTTTPVPTPTTVPVSREEVEASLYNGEYYALANEDVAVALKYDMDKLYEHWLNFGKAEGRSASLVFDAKYYLEVNRDVAAAVGEKNYEGAYEHFVASGLLEGRESSPVFDVKYYLGANSDVAEVFNNDYVKAANHFNTNALAEGRSGSGNFDYTVYRYCNTDVADLYGEEIRGYYIHYINHGRAEGRTAGFGVKEEPIDTNAVSYRIFDMDFYLENHPELATSVGETEEALYRYWLREGIGLGHVASPVFDPAEYLTINTDVAGAVGNDLAAATNHFLNYGIYEGRTGVWAFDYTVYKYCNTDVVEVFGEDIVGYYFHYVKYGRAEGRTAKLQ